MKKRVIAVPFTYSVNTKGRLVDEEIVHDAVADGTRHHGDHAALRLFGHNVHAVHELVEAAAGGSQHEERHKVPCVVIVGLHDVHHRAAQPDNARRTAEQHTGIGAENLGKEPGALLLLGDGGKLPRIVEDQTQRGQDGGQEVPIKNNCKKDRAGQMGR